MEKAATAMSTYLPKQATWRRMCETFKVPSRYCCVSAYHSRCFADSALGLTDDGVLALDTVLELGGLGLDAFPRLLGVFL